MVSVPSVGPPDPAESLVRSAARGDEAAFARIVRLHHWEMVKVCYVVTGDTETAWDAAVAAWPIALRRLSGLSDPRRLGPWLAAIAVSQALGRLERLERRARRTGATGRAASAAPSPERAAVAPDVARPAVAADVGLALATFTPEERARLALRYVAGLEAAELGPVGASSSGVGPWPGLTLGLPFGRLGRRARATRLDATTLAPGLEQGLRAYAAIPMRPVYADVVAREARDELSAARSQIISVAVAVVISALIMAFGSVQALGQAG